jgi:CHAP domain
MPTTAAMEKAVDLAEAAAGYAESACSASVGNNTRYGVWYGMNCAAWCAMFVSKCYHDAGFPQPASTSKGFAYTPSGASWYKSNNAWASPTVNPERGWVVFFYSASAARIAHVGLVRGARGSDGLIPTVEGNTNGAGSAEGGSVLLKRRSPSQSLSFRIAGYGRPDLLAGAAAEEWWQMPIGATEKAEIKAIVEGALDGKDIATQGDVVRLGQFLTRQTNTLFTASRPGMEWVGDATTVKQVGDTQTMFKAALPGLTGMEATIVEAVNRAALAGTQATLAAIESLPEGAGMTDDQAAGIATAVAASLKEQGLPEAFIAALARELSPA